jgi:hypothetical protein
MAGKAPKTVAEYLAGLPEERRSAMEAVRKLVRRNLPPGYRETLAWGGITYEVPLERYPDTYNGKPLAYAWTGNPSRASPRPRATARTTR